MAAETLRIWSTEDRTGTYQDFLSSTAGSWSSLTRVQVRNDIGSLSFTLLGTTAAELADFLIEGVLVDYYEDSTIVDSYYVMEFAYDRDVLSCSVQCTGIMAKADWAFLESDLDSDGDAYSMDAFLTDLVAATAGGLVYDASLLTTTQKAVTVPAFSYEKYAATQLAVLQDVAEQTGVSFSANTDGKVLVFRPLTSPPWYNQTFAIDTAASRFTASYSNSDKVNRVIVRRPGLNDYVYDARGAGDIYRTLVVEAPDWVKTSALVEAYAESCIASASLSATVAVPHNSANLPGRRFQFTGLGDGRTYLLTVEQVEWSMDDIDHDLLQLGRQELGVWDSRSGGHPRGSVPLLAKRQTSRGVAHTGYASGSVVIDPSAENTVASESVTFPTGAFTSTPRITVTPQTSYPDKVFATVEPGATASGCTVNLVRTTGAGHAATTIHWVARQSV